MVAISTESMNRTGPWQEDGSRPVTARSTSPGSRNRPGSAGTRVERRATGTGSVALAAVVGTVAAGTALLHSFTGFSWSLVVEVAVVAAGLSVGVAAGLVLPRRN